MTASPKVDVAVNIFAKPYQTSLSVLSLLRACDKHIDRIYLQFEAYGSTFDGVPPYVIADYLGDRAVVRQPKYWLKREAPQLDRLSDSEYRHSIRYQYAFENTDKNFLFIMHNDVLIKKDIIGSMLEKIDGAFAIGQLGQCWNCPAKDGPSVAAAGLGDTPCTPDRYREFQPDAASLARLYTIARDNGVFVRPYDEDWEKQYSQSGWPLPECRVSEWSCLVDIAQTRALTWPDGPVTAFGAFEQCGTGCLDTAVAWFRQLNRHGLFARHINIEPYMTHWVGTGKKSEYKYSQAEGNARSILQKSFAPYVTWCKKQGNGLF
ncbi:hypothetical protein LJC46_07795 [Desulfovibrio sp. OttesenSCG-928-G15]|nr:hypothetical protein [Desulfovibrio sp. OttesenSCG-928-G15]